MHVLAEWTCSSYSDPKRRGRSPSKSQGSMRQELVTWGLCHPTGPTAEAIRQRGDELLAEDLLDDGREESRRCRGLRSPRGLPCKDSVRLGEARGNFVCSWQIDGIIPVRDRCRGRKQHGGDPGRPISVQGCAACRSSEVEGQAGVWESGLQAFRNRLRRRPCRLRLQGGRGPAQDSGWWAVGQGIVKRVAVLCHSAFVSGSHSQEGDDEEVESDFGEVVCSDPEMGVEGEGDLEELEELPEDFAGQEQAEKFRQDLRVQTDNGPDNQWSTWMRRYLDLSRAWATAATRDRATVKGLSLLLFRTQLAGGLLCPESSGSEV